MNTDMGDGCNRSQPLVPRDYHPRQALPKGMLPASGECRHPNNFAPEKQRYTGYPTVDAFNAVGLSVATVVALAGACQGQRGELLELLRYGYYREAPFVPTTVQLLYASKAI